MDSQFRRSSDRRTQSKHSRKNKKRTRDKDEEVVRVVEEMKKAGVKGL